MNKLHAVLPILVATLVAAIAYAASSTASGAGPSMSQLGAVYTQTLSPGGAPATDTAAKSVSWSWNLGSCQSPISGLGGTAPYSCPPPSSLVVRLCWHTDADGTFYPTADVCKTITGQKTGTTTQWAGWLFNSGAKRLRMKLVFSSSGSGGIAPIVQGMTNSATVVW